MHFLLLIIAGFALLRGVPLLHSTVVQGYFTGKGFGGHNLPYGLMTVKLKNGQTTLATSYVQADGEFSLSSEWSGTADLYYSALGVNGEVYLLTIPASQLDTVHLSIKLPVNYPKKHNRTICPKCKRSDKVVDIVYGDGSAIVVRSISPRGDTVYRPYDNKHYYAGTCLLNDLDPNWYCLRDSLRF